MMMMSGDGVIRVSLTAVRHGETEANANCVLQGHYDSPLSEVGEKQANLCGKRLKNVLFTRVFSSDLRRAFQTASAIVNANNHFNDVREIQKDVTLRERGFGPKFENRPISEFKAAAELAGCKATMDYAPDGCESEEDVRVRATNFAKVLLHQMKSLENGSHVLVVSHGGWLRHFIGYFRASSKISRIPKMANRPCSPNTGVTEFSLNIEIITGKVKSGECLAYYDKQHLEGFDFNGEDPAFSC